MVCRALHFLRMIPHEGAVKVGLRDVGSSPTTETKALTIKTKLS